MKSTCLAAAALALLTSCSAAKKESLTLATTTSTRDSGLLDVLVPRFESATGIQVKVVAVGSGQALELGRRGDADLLLTHAPEAELQFMAEGHGALRRGVMHNDFVLVGPPAAAEEAPPQESLRETLRRIAHSETPFVSRGDESGTHMKERQLWQTAEIEPRGAWYIRAGAGMAEALRMASEKRACTLSDRGTYLALRQRLELAILVEGDPQLHNPYSVIVPHSLIGGQRKPAPHDAAARRFVDFLLADETQRLIGEFGVERFGQPLFFPLAQPAPAAAKGNGQD